MSATFPVRASLTALALPVLLAACAVPSGSNTPGSPAGAPVTATPGGTCNAAPVQSLVGRNPTASVVEDARQRAGARMARVLRPNQAVTMEFNGERLNLTVDAAGKITRVTCG